MAKTIQIISGTPDPVVAATTEYFICSNSNILSGTVEADRQVVYRQAGGFSRLWVRVTANATTSQSTIRLRIDGVSATNTITIPAGGTGEFEDTTHVDTITSGQKVGYQVVCGAGGNITFGMISILFNADTDTVSKLSVTGANYTTASISRFNQLVAEGSSAVGAESSGQTRFRTAGTLKNFCVYVNTNARTTDTVVRLRKNTANGNQVVTIPGGATGYFEDTTNVDTIAVDDLAASVVVTGTGTETIQIPQITVDFVTTNGNGFVTVGRAGGYTQTEPITSFPWISGSAIIGSATTEANTQTKTRMPMTFSQMTVNVTANTITAATTVRFRKNGVDGNQLVTIGASAVGFFTDTTNTDVCDNDDQVNLTVVTPAVSGTPNIVIRAVSMQYVSVTNVVQTSVHKYDIIEEAPSTPISQSSIHKYNLLVNISQSSIQKYNLLRYITQNSIHKYQILVNILGASIQKYNLLAYISQSSIQKYSLLRYITQASIQKYNLLVNILQSSIHKYHTLAYAIQSSIQKYNIIQNVIESSTHTYNSFANVLQQSTHKYNLETLGAVIASTIQKYNLLQYVNAVPSTQKYHILNYVTESTNHLYNILTNVVQTSIHKYSLETLGAVIANSVHHYNILQYVTQANTQKYYILNYILSESVHVYYILQYILQASTHKYGIIGSAFQVLQASVQKYNISKYVTTNSKHKYSIGILKSHLRSLYAVGGEIESSKGSRLLQNLLKELWPN